MLSTMKVALAATILCLSFAVFGATYTVNTDGSATNSMEGTTAMTPFCDVNPSMGNQNECTLHAAIQVANVNMGADTIQFSVPSITLTAGLPSVSDPVTISGPMARIDIDGNQVSSGFSFNSSAEGSTIENLVIRNFNDDGLSVSGKGYTISNNYIGTTFDGMSASANDGDGISLSISAGDPDLMGFTLPPLPSDLSDPVTLSATIVAAFAAAGPPNTITGNVISGNAEHGIDLFGGDTRLTLISSNLIGVDAAAMAALPNGTGSGTQHGINLSVGFANFIGPGNIIAGHTSDDNSSGSHGIWINPGDVRWPNLVMANFVGISPAAPVVDLGNSRSGIAIGTTAPETGMPANPTPWSALIGFNVVAYNRGDNGGLDLLNNSDAGIKVQGSNSRGVWIYGNEVGGAALDPVLDLGNAGDGINLTGESHLVGGPEVFMTNLVTANGRHGVVVRGGDFSRIQNNIIGIDLGAGFTFGNGGDGIYLSETAVTVTGGDGPTDFNRIAGNGRHGVKINGGGDTFANLLRRNLIYANAQVDMAGIGIDLDRMNNAPDANEVPSDDDNAVINNNNSNWQQNAPFLCHGAMNEPAVCSGAPLPEYSGGNTTVRWTLVSAQDADFRVEFFAEADDDMVFLGEALISTPSGQQLPLMSGPCDATGLCTSSFSSMPTNGMRLVATTTRLDTDGFDLPPTGMDPNDAGPLNNTSEFSAPATVPDTIAFAQANYSVNENVGNAMVVLQRTGGGADQVDVTVSLTDTTTDAGDHGALMPTMVSWPVGDTADKTVMVPITDDMAFENSESFDLSFMITAGLATPAAPATTTVTIADNDTAPVFDLSPAGANEGGNLVYTVTKSGATQLSASVDYAITAGAGTETADFQAVDPLSGTLTFAPMDTMMTVTILAVDDAIFEPAEDVDGTLSMPVNASIGTGTGAATIAASDTAPVVSIAGAAVTETDANQPITFALTKVGLTELPATVNYATTDGTAMTPGDYIAGPDALSGMVTFAPGSTMESITLTVVGDDIFEPTAMETFDIALSMPTSASIGTGMATGIITEDDTPPMNGTLQFTMAATTITETGAMATINVSRSGGTQGMVSVDYATMDGTATAGADYVMTSGTLTWADADGADKSFMVMITDDATDEPDETITLMLSNAQGGASIGMPNLATLTIQDDDPPPMNGSLQFTTAMSMVNENAGTATITVSRMGGTTGMVSVDYTTMDGTATAGADYVMTSGTLTWADADGADKSFMVMITDDATDEPDETITLMLSNAQGGASIGMPNQATLTIQDDDPPPMNGSLQFTTAMSMVNENAGTATITVSRMGGTTGMVSVDYATMDGTATAGADYVMTSGTLTWADADGADKSFMVMITDDATDEPDETITLMLSNAQGGASIGMPNLATLTIQDDDPPPMNGSLQFTTAMSMVNENAGTATITVSRMGGTTGMVSVDYATMDGTATAGSDYVMTSGTLTWADADGADKSFMVMITDDATDEPDETITLMLSNAQGGASIGMPNLATLTIQDDDPPPMNGSLQFTTAMSMVNENAGTATITVSRMGGTAGMVSVDYATMDGTATAGADYVMTSGTLTWADTDGADKSFMVMITDDATDEPDETITLMLSNAQGGASIGMPNLATLTIQDDDPPPMNGSLQFTTAMSMVNENAGTATITVSRMGGTAGMVSVDYTTMDGTATAGADYVMTSGTLTWADADGADKSFMVMITDDATDEPDETITLMLSNAQGGASIGMPNTTTLTIMDDDTPGIKTFSGPTTTGSGISSAMFTGGGVACGFVANTALENPPMPLPTGGYTFPHGVLRSEIAGCTPGATLSFTVTYPQSLPPQTVFWKYGPQQMGGASDWYIYPATISGNTATFTVTDGALGDDDFTANGIILDPSGPAFIAQGGTPIEPLTVPTLSQWARIVLTLILAGVGLAAYRDQQSRAESVRSRRR